jgi:hypothetical protein
VKDIVIPGKIEIFCYFTLHMLYNLLLPTMKEAICMTVKKEIKENILFESLWSLLNVMLTTYL